jgi:hypothetical protein
MKRLNLNLPLLEILAAFALILAFLMLIAPEPARADSTAYTRTDCQLTKAENGNWLTYTGACAGGEVITGGYSSSIGTFDVQRDGETETVTARTDVESRGGRFDRSTVLSREIAAD